MVQIMNWRLFVNWILGNKFQWNFNQNTTILFQEIAIENGFFEMAAILSQSQWVNTDAA